MSVLCLTMGLVSFEENRLRAVCIGRHHYLAGHFARFFAEFDIETLACAGLDQAIEASRDFKPDVVICDYDLLVSLPLETWERDELLSRTPAIAVSLTRRPQEAHLLDVNGIAGFLYLPLLDRDAAARIISAAAAASRRRYVPAPATSSPIHLEATV